MLKNLPDPHTQSLPVIQKKEVAPPNKVSPISMFSSPLMPLTTAIANGQPLPKETLFNALVESANPTSVKPLEPTKSELPKAEVIEPIQPNAEVKPDDKSSVATDPYEILEKLSIFIGQLPSPPKQQAAQEIQQPIGLTS